MGAVHIYVDGSDLCILTNVVILLVYLCSG